MSETGYVELLLILASRPKVVHHKSESLTHKLADRDARVKQLELKVQLLTDEAGKVADMQMQLTAKVAEIASEKEALVEKDTALKAKT